MSDLCRSSVPCARLAEVAARQGTVAAATDRMLGHQRVHTGQQAHTQASAASFLPKPNVRPSSRRHVPFVESGRSVGSASGSLGGVASVSQSTVRHKSARRALSVVCAAGDKLTIAITGTCSQRLPPCSSPTVCSEHKAAVSAGASSQSALCRCITQERRAWLAAG